MIKTKDVIRMKIPFPTISDKLAVNAHMYICGNASGSEYEFIKCQRVKPYMLTQDIFRHYVDEMPDISRNPFQHMTRIDCDKKFTTSSVIYADSLRTTQRPDICDELYEKVTSELNADGYEIIGLNESELVKINPSIRIA